MKQIKYIEFDVYRTSVLNICYGVSNKELLPLAKTEGSLSKMAAIKYQVDTEQFSKNLFKVLGDKQKFGLRTVIRETVPKLISNKTKN